MAAREATEPHKEMINAPVDEEIDKNQCHSCEMMLSTSSPVKYFKSERCLNGQARGWALAYSLCFAYHHHHRQIPGCRDVLYLKRRTSHCVFFLAPVVREKQIFPSHALEVTSLHQCISCDCRRTWEPEKRPRGRGEEQEKGEEEENILLPARVTMHASDTCIMQLIM